MTDVDIHSATFRRVLGHYPTGVCVVTAMEPEGTPTGMVVGSFTSVSLDPPLVGFFPAKDSTSWPRIKGASRFCINILAADQVDLCKRLARTGRDKFAGIPIGQTPRGSPLLDGVIAWIDCTLHSVHEAGDHLFVLGRVIELDVIRPDSPLIFLRSSYGQFAACEA